MAETVLDRIVADVRRRLEDSSMAPGLEEAAFDAAENRRAEGRRSLIEALSGPGPALIAECKKASPSAGTIREDFDPVTLARAYAAGGASAISVVTEPDSFHGDTRWLVSVRQEVGLPVLRKDFIFTRRQMFETSVLGADAVLLIARILDDEALTDLVSLGRELELDVLLEIFADEDPARAAASGAPILGVNARDLATFEVRLGRVASMASRLPSDRVRVAESGIHGAADLAPLTEAGYDAFLVGEHLVRSDDPEVVLRALLAGTAR